MVAKVQVADPWRSTTRNFNSSGKQFSERKNMNIYWPGTKIVKSQNNAFTSWMTKSDSLMANDDSLRKSQSATRGRTMNDPLPAHLRIYKEKK